MRSGETDLGLTVDNARFIELAKILSQATKHKGILSVDVLADEADTLNLLEMNCRISGHYPVAHCAGVNYPKQLIEWLNKKETNLENFEYKRGVYVTKELLPVVWQ
jgi:carbamoyl-phosphate synthase large subunit